MTPPADIGRAVAARQDAARAQMAAAKKKIATLERERRAVLIADDDIKTVLAHDDQITEQRRIIAALEARVAALSQPLSPDEAQAFGHDAVRHPVTKMPLEQGIGALSPDQQARLLHLPIITAKEGPEVAAAMLQKLDAAARPAGR
jgi:hypothetical protein